MPLKISPQSIPKSPTTAADTLQLAEEVLKDLLQSDDVDLTGPRAAEMFEKLRMLLGCVKFARSETCSK